MSRSRVLLGGFLLLVFAGAVVHALLEPPGHGHRSRLVSSENTDPEGARALYLWLRELGYPTRSWRRPLTALGEGQRALFVLAPTQSLTDGQVRALFDWVKGGGTLFVAPGSSTALERALERWVILDFDETAPAEVRGDRAVPHRDGRWRYREVRSDEGGLFPYPVEEVAVRGPGRVRDPGGEHSLLFAREGAGLVAEIFHGEGAIVLFPEPDVLTNSGLGKGGNVELVAGLVEDWIERGTEVWFDEYDHGARVAGSVGIYLARRRPGLFGMAFLAAGILGVIRYGRSLTTREEEPVKRRRRPAEFVEALGSLYLRARAVAPAWASLAETGRRIVRGELAAGRARVAGAAGREERLAALRAALAGGSPGGPTERDLVSLSRAIARALSPGGAGEAPSPPGRSGRAAPQRIREEDP